MDSKKEKNKNNHLLLEKTNKNDSTKKNNKKNDIDISNEIQQYLSQNESLMKAKKEENSEIEKIKEENSNLLQKSKSLSKTELFDLIISSLKESLQLKKDFEDQCLKNDLIQEETRNIYKNAQKVENETNE